MQIISAIITAAFALCGTALTVFWGNRQSEKNILKSTDVIVYRLNVLEKKVDALAAVLPGIKKEQRYQKRSIYALRAQNRV